MISSIISSIEVNVLTPYQTILTFNDLEEESLYPFPKQAQVFTCMQYKSFEKKTQWEKEKLLVTSNFSFSYSVFYLFGELSAIFVKFETVVCKLCLFGRVKFVVWEWVKIARKK